MFKYILLTFFLVITMSAYAVSDDSRWVKAMQDTSIAAVEQTLNGGYIAAGSTYSRSSDAALLFRFDSSGKLQWAKTYEGTSASTVLQVADGGFVFAGSNRDDAVVVKVDVAGNILWQKAYGTSSKEDASVIIQSSDGGFFVLGDTYQEGPVSDIWCMRLTSDGSILWTKIYGRTDKVEWLSAAVATSDGGLVFVGTRWPSWPVQETICVKIGPSGKIIWQKVLTTGSEESLAPNTISTTADDGYVIGGWRNQQIWGMEDDSQGWVAKLDSNGNLAWKRAFGDSVEFGPSGMMVEVNAVRQEKDGHILVMGVAPSPDGQGYHYWSARLSSEGQMFWQKAFGETFRTYSGLAIHETADDGTVFSGSRSMHATYARSDGLIGRIPSRGTVCKAFRESTKISSFETTIRAESVHVGKRKGVFAVRTASIVQAPFRTKIMDLCK